MARYIDAERLKDAFHTDTEHLQSRDEHLFDLIMFEIDEQPTADVVEVTRCSNCKYIKTFTCPITRTETLFCDYGEKPAQVEAEHYCGYGERRDA